LIQSTTSPSAFQAWSGLPSNRSSVSSGGSGGRVIRRRSRLAFEPPPLPRCSRRGCMCAHRHSPVARPTAHSWRTILRAACPPDDARWPAFRMHVDSTRSLTVEAPRSGGGKTGGTPQRRIKNGDTGARFTQWLPWRSCYRPCPLPGGPSPGRDLGEAARSPTRGVILCSACRSPCARHGAKAG